MSSIGYYYGVVIDKETPEEVCDNGNTTEIMTDNKTPTIYVTIAKSLIIYFVAIM